jgi:hypothetical protein
MDVGLVLLQTTVQKGAVHKRPLLEGWFTKMSRGGFWPLSEQPIWVWNENTKKWVVSVLCSWLNCWKFSNQSKCLMHPRLTFSTFPSHQSFEVHLRHLSALNQNSIRKLHKINQSFKVISNLISSRENFPAFFHFISSNKLWSWREINKSRSSSNFPPLFTLLYHSQKTIFLILF